MRTRDEAIAFLYDSYNQFAAAVAPVFRNNQWTWGSIIPGQMAVPTEKDIAATVMTMIYECYKSGGQNMVNTGRIEVFLRQTDRGDWVSGIQLVPISMMSY